MLEAAAAHFARLALAPRQLATHQHVLLPIAIEESPSPWGNYCLCASAEMGKSVLVRML
jgi:hypothetical protein